MEDVVLWMSISLDGFMAGPGGELDWHMVDEELHQYAVTRSARRVASETV